MINTEKNTNLPLIIWASCLLILLFILVLVGGATRITDSGLSITEWEVLIGIFPPLSESSWKIDFEKYKKIPEYILINSSMTFSIRTVKLHGCIIFFLQKKRCSGLSHLVRCQNDAYKYYCAYVHSGRNEIGVTVSSPVIWHHVGKRMP